MFSKIYTFSWIRWLAFVWQRKPSRPIRCLSISVKCICILSLFHIPRWDEERLWCLMSVALRSGNEVRAIFVCLSKCIHLTLTVHVIITIIGYSCSTPWYQAPTWFLDFLHQILNDNNGCLQRQSRHKELNPASGKIVRDDDEEK